MPPLKNPGWFTFERKILAFFLLVVLISTVIIVLGVKITRETKTDRLALQHSESIVSLKQSILSDLRDVVIQTRGFLLTGDSGYVRYSTPVLLKISDSIRKLQVLAEGNKIQSNLVDSIRRDFNEYRIIRNAGIRKAIMDDLGPDKKIELINTANVQYSSLSARLNRLDLEAKTGMQKMRRDYQESVLRSAVLVRYLLIIFVLLILVAFLLVYLNARKRNRAEGALRKNQGLIRGFIDHAPVLVNVKDLQGRFLLVNDQFAAVFHTTPEQLTGKTNQDILPAEIADALDKDYHEVEKTRQPTETEIELTLADGPHFFIVSKFPLFDEKENLYAIGSTLSDITHVKQVHNELQKSYLKQQKILNGIQGVYSASSDVICMINKEGELTMISDTVEQLLGYTPKSMISKRFLDFVVEEDREKTRLISSSIMSGKEVTGFTNRWKKKNGETLPFMWSARWSTEDELMYCIGRNASEGVKTAEQLARSEAQLANALHIARLGNWQWDVLDNEWTFSDEMYELLGIHNKDAALNQDSMLKLIHPEDRDKVMEEKESIADGKGKIDLEYRIIRPDGQVCYVHAIGEVKHGADGKPVALSGTLQDITDRKKAELSLKKLNEDLQKRARELKLSNAELERFAYVASHDLQEPLRMVSSFLTLLQKKLEGQLDESTKQYIHFAVDGAERMKSLIQDLLQYSRLGTDREEKVPVDLNETLEQVKLTYAFEMKAMGARVESSALPVVKGNKTQLSRLFQNLIGNALKYRSEDAPLIRVNCREEEDAWLICIRDNGIGIDTKFFDKIFIIFQRLHNKKEYAGTGIGLAISKKIVELHGGRIWVESEPGQGSSFYFTLKK